MAPKKPVGKGAVKGKVDSTPPTGIQQPAQVPLWDIDDVLSEHFGDLEAATDAVELFEDPTIPLNSEVLNSVIGDWKRPGALFIPFKPIVVRAPTSSDGKADDISVWRTTIARFKGLHDEVKGMQSKRKQRQTTSSGIPFIQAFHSAVLCMAQLQQFVPRGNYLWELIYPQIQHNGCDVPVYNPHGKYIVKVFWNGAYRKVVIDDRLPSDTSSKCIFGVTETKEIWPALLMKAMWKVLTVTNERHLFKDPVWCLTTLLGSWLPEHMKASASAEVLRYIRTSLTHTEKVPTKRDVVAVEEKKRDDPITPRAAESKSRPSSSSKPPPKKGDNSKKNTVEEEENQVKGEEDNDFFIVCATCGDCYNEAYSKSVDELEAVGLLEPNVYLVLDTRPYKNTTLLRICSSNVKWSGECSYSDNSLWTPQFEQQIGFSRDVSPIAPTEQWADFWVTWETFAKYFTDVYVLRNISASRLYQCSQQFQPQTIAQINEAQQQTELIPESHQCYFQRYLCIKSLVPTQLCFSITGLIVPVEPEPAEQNKKGPAKSVERKKPQEESVEITATTPRGEDESRYDFLTVKVSKYNWKEAVQLRQVCSFQTTRMHSNSHVLQVPNGVNVYKIELLHPLPPEKVFCILSPREVVVSDLGDIQLNYLGVHNVMDAGEMPDHQGGETSVWFKRYLNPKSELELRVSLSFLSNAANLLALQAGQSADKKKQPKKDDKQVKKDDRKNVKDAKTDKPVTPRTTTTDDLNTILPYLTLSLVNCDTCAVTTSVINQLPLLTLPPTKGGYVLLLYCTAPHSFNSSRYWVVSVLTNYQGFQMEPRACEAVAFREGVYVPNTSYQLFRYTVTSQEVCFISLHLRVLHKNPFPMKCSITVKNESTCEILFHDDLYTSSVVVPNLLFLPSDKISSYVYSITGILDSTNAEYLHQQLHLRQVKNFEAAAEAAKLSIVDTIEEKLKLCLQQKAQVAEIQQKLNTEAKTGKEKKGGQEKKEAKPEGKKSATDQKDAKGKGKEVKKGNAQEDLPRVWSATPQPLEVLYSVKVLSTTNKLTVEEDTSVLDEQIQTKLKWATTKTEMEGIPPRESRSQGKESRSATDLPSSRVHRERQRDESRAMFLVNPQGLFVPVPVTPEELQAGRAPICTEDDDKSFRTVAARPLQTVPTLEDYLAKNARCDDGTTTDTLAEGAYLARVAESLEQALSGLDRPKHALAADSYARIQSLLKEKQSEVHEEEVVDTKKPRKSKP